MLKFSGAAYALGARQVNAVAVRKNFFKKELLIIKLPVSMNYHCGKDCATRERDNVVSETGSVIAEKFAC